MRRYSVCLWTFSHSHTSTFNGSELPDHIKKDMDAYANPPLVISASRTGMSSFAGQEFEEQLYASFERGFDNPAMAFPVLTNQWKSIVHRSLSQTYRSSWASRFFGQIFMLF